ncbi:uncharacterized protein LOC112905798 [Agrilus planipennis]|uniref:Uncharacterized protein LOC112905798 n=1 Tax=Agrilus planipennis TaxID=224129 RepID=A0A7F5RFF3_AGRPL|nr:uncharacterized protein LOC112905798 [Agrilus planipennis]
MSKKYVLIFWHGTQESSIIKEEDICVEKGSYDVNDIVDVLWKDNKTHEGRILCLSDPSKKGSKSGISTTLKYWEIYEIGKVEFIKGSNIWISLADLEFITDLTRNDPDEMARKLLKHFIEEEVYQNRVL